MQQATKLFLQDNTKLLEENKIQELYEKATASASQGTVICPELTYLFYDIDVDPLEGSDTIYSFMFEGAQYLSSFKIPDNIKTIKGAAFSYSNIGDITLPDSLTYIGSNAFSDCQNIRSVVIPENCVTLCPNIFSRCKNLKSAVIKAPLQFLIYGLFRQCVSLKTVELPGTITDIEASAFENCNELELIKFHGTQEEWEKITLPDYFYESLPSLKNIEFI